jgi:catechol 2,3-dioxygenase-like lactoylglutathione lyase family enzyme
LYSLAAVAFLVPSYDEGLSFFRDGLGFEVVEDTHLGQNKRWVVVAPPGGRGAPHSYWRFLPTADSGQESAIRQAEALATFSSPTTSRQIMRSCVHGGSDFLEDPRSERYGRVAVFVDPWGGKWDLLEPTGRGGDVV